LENTFNMSQWSHLLNCSIMNVPTCIMTFNITKIIRTKKKNLSFCPLKTWPRMIWTICARLMYLIIVIWLTLMMNFYILRGTRLKVRFTICDQNLKMKRKKNRCRFLKQILKKVISLNNAIKNNNKLKIQFKTYNCQKLHWNIMIAWMKI